MLDCKRCKHEDCDFKKDISNAINIIKGYIPYRAVEKIEEIIDYATEDCEDFEEAD